MPLLSPLVLIISTALANNIVLTNFLGVTEVTNIDETIQEKSATPTDYIKYAKSLSLIVLITLVISLPMVFFIYTNLLARFDLLFLQNILFIMVTAIIGNVITKYYEMKKSAGVKAIAVTLNSVVLGIFLIDPMTTIVTALIYAFGTALGFGLVLYIVTTIRIRLQVAKVIKSFEGYPILLVTLAIAAMAFRGFLGM